MKNIKLAGNTCTMLNPVFYVYVLDTMCTDSLLGPPIVAVNDTYCVYCVPGLFLVLKTNKAAVG